jgi:hypothetical protein
LVLIGLSFALSLRGFRLRGEICDFDDLKEDMERSKLVERFLR